MGLITQSNAKYYTGNEVNFFASSVSSLQPDIGVDLNDIVPGLKAANYKIFVDPTGSGVSNNYIIFPKQVEFGVVNVDQNNFTPNSAPTLNASAGTYTVAPTSGNGVGLLLSVQITSGNIFSITIINAGNDYTPGTVITLPAGSLGAGSVASSYTIQLTDTFSGNAYEVENDGTNIINFNTPIPGPLPPYTQIAVKVQLENSAIWDNFGSYEYITLNDVVDNFIVGYTGQGKLLQNVRRSDIVFHAKRGLQEFSYDTLRSVKSQELDLLPNAVAAIPQDYVNYVQVSWVDGSGVKHPIYPTTLTSNPTSPLIQGADGLPIQDQNEQNLEAGEARTNIRWRTNNNQNLNGLVTTQDLNANIYNWTWWDQVWGQRYGQDQVVSNMNGWFTINRRTNTFNFSSNLLGQMIILEYISDGLAYDEDTKIPKMAEQAMYMHIAYSLLSTMPNIQEYVVRRYKIDRRAALRNAKIRLQNIKLSEFIQVMRGKSKWIKH
tara:strand:+ start:1544 stop:3016 length:1473 start_codon:yes stop_codon:yes gene_type:complete